MLKKELLLFAIYVLIGVAIASVANWHPIASGLFVIYVMFGIIKILARGV